MFYDLHVSMLDSITRKTPHNRAYGGVLCFSRSHISITIIPLFVLKCMNVFIRGENLRNESGLLFIDEHGFLFGLWHIICHLD